MTNSEWTSLCNANWHRAAARLAANGWFYKKDKNAFFGTFRKRGVGKCYLGRQLGSSEWYPIKV